MPDEKKEMVNEEEVKTEEIVEDVPTEKEENMGGENPVENPVAENQTENPVSLGEEEDVFNLQEFLEIPEVKDFIQKVRKQEKDKLYTEIQKKDTKIKELEGEILLLNNRLKSSTEISINEQEELRTEVQQLSETVAELKKDIRRKELDLFKERACFHPS